MKKCEISCRDRKNIFRLKRKPTVLDQLEQLGRLKESGVLTEEEFLEQKKKLINKS
ncbi:SHOCT domain-containing protein [Chryseobacterium ginsenosidimutans]|uniref:SHOCT domain-containing protein n=1 Tax=Chryseobacterium ginsenosidimutans TaxID=687846 RepID=UPI0035B6AA19